MLPVILFEFPRERILRTASYSDLKAVVKFRKNEPTPSSRENRRKVRLDDDDADDEVSSHHFTVHLNRLSRANEAPGSSKSLTIATPFATAEALKRPRNANVESIPGIESSGVHGFTLTIGPNLATLSIAGAIASKWTATKPSS